MVVVVVVLLLVVAIVVTLEMTITVTVLGREPFAPPPNPAGLPAGQSHGTQAKRGASHAVLRRRLTNPDSPSSAIS